jgi:hypothetical protein
MDSPPPGFLSPAAFAFAQPFAGAQAGPAPVVPVVSGKTSGLGDNFYIGGNDISGDVSVLNKISGSQKTLNVTGINVLAMERLGGQRDGAMDFVVYFNPARAHPVLSALPTADVQASYRRSTVLGAPAAEIFGRQIDYNPTRATDGSLTVAVSVLGDGFGLEWGVQLTPGLRADVGATNGPAVDTGVAAGSGAQAYLQVTAFTGTDVTVKVQDSADEVTWADVTGLTFAQTTGAQTTQRIATSGSQMVRRFLRAVTVTSGGFTECTFAVTVAKNLTATVF